MGSTFAESLMRKGHQVFGFDKDQKVIEKAIKDQVIYDSNLDLIDEADLIMLCLYPKQNIEFVRTHKNRFNKQLITDISGTKVHMINEILSILPHIRYVSTHPMAGREKNGYDNRDLTMFKDANFLIVKNENSTMKDIKLIEGLAKELAFGRITTLDPREHDQLIAHTSQLTHLLAVSLMLSDDSVHTKDATGDSFRDLTRIAKINEEMWSELFMDNKEALIEETNRFISVLENLKNMIKHEDYSQLKSNLRKSKEKRISFDESKSR
ncbi:Arogenate dehydrogenase [Acholeplasma hippikon]|uniref:Arogenate dehydrogenase n=2 Tax=Acholeplasma hippikon TaxID=264636 RepID=A0A449BK85_9MOLU|nr:Arogenate dehydrogenase [Acholeplasma hippikon]